MAIRGTANHRKIMRLSRRLDIDPCFALGVMEAIWHITAEQQPDGGIGRLSDQDIADEIGYTKCAETLIKALVDAKWLDQVLGVRLYIHDWHVWADDGVISKLVKRTLRFANGEIPRLTKYSTGMREKILAHYAQDGPTVRELRTLRVPVPVPEPVPVPVPEPVPEPKNHDDETSIPVAPPAPRSSGSRRSPPTPKSLDPNPPDQIRKSNAGHLTAHRIERMWALLTEHMGDPPERKRDEAIILRSLEAVDGAPMETVALVFGRMRKEGKLAGREGGPRSYAWFPPVLAAMLEGWRDWPDPDIPVRDPPSKVELHDDGLQRLSDEEIRKIVGLEEPVLKGA